jgi:hypothetical protein
MRVGRTASRKLPTYPVELLGEDAVGLVVEDGEDADHRFDFECFLTCGTSPGLVNPGLVSCQEIGQPSYWPLGM